jgi:nucleotide-binding universal stress UspA family protein
LILIHVVDGDLPEHMIAVDRQAAEATLQEISWTLRTNDQIASEPMVAVDDVPSGLLSAAEDVNADLIILGPHRRRFADVFIGTTVERVVRRSRFPLLVASQPPAAPYQRTLLALDFDEASQAAARVALGMGIFDNTAVIIMHAFDTPAVGMLKRSTDTSDAIEHYVAGEQSKANERLSDLVRELGLPASDQRVVAMIGTPARSILESARRESVHLVVLGTNQRKGFERLLIGSVTEDVIRDANRDVLIIPIDEQ